MDILPLVIFAAISPLLILIGVLYLGRHLLKRKLNPSEEYLGEIKEVKAINRLSFVNSIIILMVMMIQNFNEIITLLLILMVIIELIRNKYVLSHLKTKDESTSTRKYILYDLCFQVIVLTAGLGLYFLLLNFLSSKL